jgi:PTS system ascorbate-specific IIB component
MKTPRIMVVCGFGLGSSLILRMTLDEVLQEHQIKAETFCADAETAIGQNYDLVLTSAGLAKLFSTIPQPVVVIADFLSSDEVAQKVLPVLSSLS